MNSSRSGRPPKVSKDDILDAARELLANGVETFSMRKLSQQVGVGLSSIYRHYANKDALLQVLAEELVEGVWASVDLQGSWDERLFAWSRAFWQMLLSNPGHIAMLSKITGSRRDLDQLDMLADFICEAGIAKREALLKAQGLVWVVWGFAYFSLEYRSKDELCVEHKAPAEPKYQQIVASLATDNTDELFETAICDHILGIKASAGV